MRRDATVAPGAAGSAGRRAGDLTGQGPLTLTTSGRLPETRREKRGAPGRARLALLGRGCPRGEASQGGGAVAGPAQ